MSIRINIGTDFDARDIRQARKEIDALEDQLKGLNSALGDSMRSAQKFSDRAFRAGTMLTSSLTVPIVGAAVASTALAANFAESMSRITGLVGIASDEVKAMETAVLGLSGNTAKSPRELAEGLFVVTSAGLRGAEAMEALEFAAKAGAAGLGATNDIARAVAGAINAYGAETLDAARATDIIVATARAGNFATDQFAGALGRVLPFAQQAQASLEDVGGAVALLTRTNGNAAESITQIQALFRAFVVPTEEAKKLLDEVGLSAADLRREMGARGLVSTLQLLDNRLGGNREVMGRLLSSTEAASAAFQILNSDANTIAETFGVVEDSVGMTADAFDVVAEQPAFKFRQALNDLQVAGIELGNRLLPVVTRITDAFTNLIDKFTGLTETQQNLLIGAAAFLAIIGPLALLVGSFTGVVAALIPVVGSLGAAVAVATGGLSLLAAAIVGVGFWAFSSGADTATTSLEHQARAAEHAAAGYHALADAELRAADAAKLREDRQTNEESRSSGRAARLARRTAETEAAAAAERAMADAMSALGEATKSSGDEIAASGPKVVSLTKSMRELFQELNETHVGAGDAGDAIAQFSREVLAMGNITEGTIRGAERLAQVIKQDIDRSLADANRRLDEATGRFNAFRDAISGGIRSGNTLADATREQTAATDALARAQAAYQDALEGEDEDRIADAAKDLADAESNQKTFLEFLGVGVTTAEGFAAQIDALREAGASLEVVQQIAELGARTGGRVAAELLDGGAAAIEQANRMVTAVEEASRRAGIAAAEQFFGAGVNAAKAMVRGIEATIPELQGVLDRIADAIERAMGTRPNVDITGRTQQYIAPTPPPEPTPRPQTAFQKSIAATDWAALSRELGSFGGIPAMADGGIVTSPTLALIGESGPEAVIPLNSNRARGGQTIVNVTVTSADPQAVVEAIRRYTRSNGPLGSSVTL